MHDPNSGQILGIFTGHNLKTVFSSFSNYMVPIRTWKPGKIRRASSSQGILLRQEKSGNFTQNTGKIGKNYTGKFEKKYWKS